MCGLLNKPVGPLMTGWAQRLSGHMKAVSVAILTAPRQLRLWVAGIIPDEDAQEQLLKRRLTLAIEQLDETALPSQQSLNDALLWHNKRAYLLVPLTGPYERYRAPHLERLVSLANILADHELAVCTEEKGLRHTLRAVKGSSLSWSFRDRHRYFLLEKGVASTLLSILGS